MKIHSALFAFLIAILLIICRHHPSFSSDLSLDIERLNQQVIALYQQGKYQEAIPIGKKALQTSKQKFGLEDEKSLDSAANLACLYLAVGKYAEAEVLFKRTQQLTEKKYGPDHLRTGVNCNYLGWIYQKLGRYDEALSFYKRTLAIYRKSLDPGHIEIATILNNLAALHTTIGAYNKANSYYDQALSITEKKLGKNNVEVARILTNQSTPLYYLDDFDKAESSLLRALDIQEKNLDSNHPNVAETLNNLGGLYSRIGAYNKAKKYLKRALVIREKVYGKVHPDVAENIFNLATLHHRSGAFEIAEKEYLRALSIREEKLGTTHPYIAVSLNNLAALYEEQGFYEKAKPLYERSFAISRKVYGTEHRMTASSLNNLAILYYNLGDYEKAENYFYRSLRINEKIFSSDHLDMATSYNNIGSFLYRRINEYDEAERLLKKSITIREKKLGPDHFKTKESWNNLAFSYLDHGLLQEAFEIFSIQESLRGLGKYYLRKNDFKNALEQFQKSAGNSSKRKKFQITDLIGLGLAYEGLGQYEKAKVHFKKAISLIEEQWHALSPKDRSKFLDGSVGIGFKRLDAFEGMIRVSYKENKKDSAQIALWYAEKVKSRDLLEMLATKDIKQDNKIDPVLIAAAKDKLQKLRAAGARLAKVAEQDSKVPIRFQQEAQSEYTTARDNYEKFIQEVQSRHPEFVSLITTVDPVSVEKIQSLLDTNTTLLEFYIADTDVYVWVVRYDSIEMQRLAIKTDNLVSMVNDLLLPAYSNRLRSPKVVTFPSGVEITTVSNAAREKKRKQLVENAQKLYSALLAPVASSLTTKNLAIISHGPLHKVPFSALHDGDNFIIDTFTISVAPSANVLKYVSAKRNPDHGKLVGFANPITKEGVLKFAEQEVSQISRLFNQKSIHTKAEATESKARNSTTGSDVIHFACHGEFDEKHPMQSALLLTSDEKNDGRLEVSEIFDLDLQGTNLVALSACETAAAKIQGGDDLVGLSRGFIYAGTPSLLATLWKVDDKSTEKLMKDFYYNWRTKKLSKADALRQAQLSLKTDKRYSHPFYWAPFVIIGDWL